MGQTLIFRVVVPPPPGVAAQDSAAKFAEGRARFFLWVWPQFLGWSKPFVWLFSPDNGNRPLAISTALTQRAT